MGKFSLFASVKTPVRKTQKSSLRDFDTFSKCNTIGAIAQPFSFGGNFGGKERKRRENNGAAEGSFFHPVLFKVHEKTMDYVVYKMASLSQPQVEAQQ